ncbi:hypothetical protein HFP57_16120 [Parasphingopyxis algicola]|uniref:RraA family protein n=1 Tax=Parasphingopyxis algicola TaxID=2026624 RepID=UPI00159FAB03|nr:hypothetical protein [Parasphingopyxis algicola]QLC26406.1 hypothetical protein HFP57_16120 [Parasphingopyxis algicola]
MSVHTVYATIERPAPDIVDRFSKVWIETVAQSAADKVHIVDPVIKPLANRDWRICGPAVTVLPNGTDTMMSIAATSIAQAGDVIVVAAGGDCGAGVWGNGTTISARNRDLAGAVVDGAVIDCRAILEGGTPVFARSATMRHTVAARPGSINVDVEFGGVEVSPGDIVLGDMDGLVVIPREDAKAVIELAEKRSVELEEAKAKLVHGVTLFDLRGGRPMLEALGVEWVE